MRGRGDSIIMAKGGKDAGVKALLGLLAKMKRGKHSKKESSRKVRRAEGIAKSSLSVV